MKAVLICAENKPVEENAVLVGKLYHEPGTGLVVQWLAIDSPASEERIISRVRTREEASDADP